MSKFLQCELFTFLKLFVLLIGLNLFVKIIAIDSYSKMIFMGSLISIVLYILVFIWKLIRLLTLENTSEYQCQQGETLKKALTWLSNIV